MSVTVGIGELVAVGVVVAVGMVAVRVCRVGEAVEDAVRVAVADCVAVGMVAVGVCTVGEAVRVAVVDGAIVGERRNVGLSLSCDTVLGVAVETGR